MARWSDYPEGLAEDHAAADGRLRRHASPISILILGTLIAAALGGLLAGGKVRPISVSAPQAAFTVATPRVVRNGVFFETRVRIVARAPIAAPTIAVDASLWRDLTINTQYPDPDKQGFKDGAFTSTYPAMRPGEVLEVKLDGQVNPPLTLGDRGTIALLDGERRIAAVPIDFRVLP